MTPFVGEIRMFGGSYAPDGWLMCDGQLVPIEEYDVLYWLIGTTYGGDGLNTFALPDLRGRVPVHRGDGSTGHYVLLGQRGGVEQVALTPNQVPGHSHVLLASKAPGNTANPTGLVMADSAAVKRYAAETATENLHGQAVTSVGAGQPHSNMQPFLCISFIISTYGVVPTTD